MSTFLESYIRPYTRWGLPGYHAVMLVNAGIFLAAMYYLIRKIFKEHTGALFVMLVTVMAVFLMPGTEGLRELFYWFTGAMANTVLLSLAFLSAGLFLAAKDAVSGKKETACIACSAVCGFFASAGSLQVTSPNCAWLLAALILSGRDILKTRRRLLIPFFSAFAGAVINTVAPGNYVRAEISDAGIPWREGLSNTVVYYTGEMKGVLGTRAFLILLAITLVVSVMLRLKVCQGGMPSGKLAVTLIGSMLVQFFTAFPVILANHTDTLGAYRHIAVNRMVYKLMCLFFILCAAQWAGERFGTKINRRMLVALSVLLLLGGALAGSVRGEVESSFSYCSYLDLQDGSLRDAYATREYILSVLALLPEGTDAQITAPVRAYPRTAYGMGLLDDTEWIVNRSAAGLFGLNSVSVTYQYE